MARQSRGSLMPDETMQENRRDAILKRMLQTPPQPKKAEGNALVHEFVVLDGQMLVAVIAERNERSITADLYRNENDLREGRAMERRVRLELQSSPAM